MRYDCWARKELILTTSISRALLMTVVSTYSRHPGLSLMTLSTRTFYIT